MREAIRLASCGMGKTSPNPMVGAVIVKGGNIVGTGYHKGAGTPHAEVVAINRAGANTDGATLYVNFEPCCHWGRTPPCTQAIIKAGIKEVHASIIDPSVWVNGKGIKELKDAGIKVIVGELADKASELNAAYIKWAKTGLPYVILKAAITLDGKIADGAKRASRLSRFGGGYCGISSKWITSEVSRKFVHRLRAQVDAVMVGIGTVIADDPSLTVRLVRGKNPKRIILDSNLRTPREAKILGNGCIIATLKNSRVEGAFMPRQIEGAEVWQIQPNDKGKVDILEVLKRAAKTGIQSILIEGGKEVFTDVLSRQIVDKVYCFIAPKIIGNGVPVIGDLGIKNIQEALTLNAIKIRKFGHDILVEGKFSH
ncbi:MAG: bifunctional diaminohydroxyphosphoribosylaminopyrimidine deaminase/5-amino-6-(5-phosphoribosylamino)uracil reductase RibD [Candidatus Stahlbacteria bacterium]|nr:bifunctional diaminohydroxyphosphoribosylaminopyrimidine deaminase/5-amino-6-(5-phosphoribosylamino)uracil reductase RibD [Candidatus Stahlbacteria bacterium]